VWLDASSSETRIGSLTRCHPVRRASAPGKGYGPRPGESMRAVSPAMKPTMMIQMMLHTTISHDYASMIDPDGVLKAAPR